MGCDPSQERGGFALGFKAIDAISLNMLCYRIAVRHETGAQVFELHEVAEGLIGAHRCDADV